MAPVLFPPCPLQLWGRVDPGDRGPRPALTKPLRQAPRHSRDRWTAPGGRPDTPAQATGRRGPRIIPRGCHLPATHPAAASWPHYLPARPCAAWKPVHGSPRHSGRDRGRGHSGTWGAWTSRKPLLLLRFDGLFLLRFAERRFRGLLFQEPPRTTARTSTGSRPAQIRWNTTPASNCSNRASQSA